MDLQLISPTERENLLATTSPPLLIDLRDDDDYHKGHIPGARWVCRQNCLKRITAMARQQGRPVVLYCYHGGVSMMLCRDLQDIGCPATSLCGGFESWKYVHRKQ